MNVDEYITTVRQDWPDPNLVSLQEVLREACDAVLDRTNERDDPLLNSPNLRNLRGYYRWALVPKYLERAIEIGKFSGLEPNWVPLGGVHMFELRGQHTVVTVCHLSEEDEVPKQSEYRKIARRLNPSPQMDYLQPPVLENGEKLHLTLVYGGKDGEFAYLRAYFDEEKRSYYHKVSMNIMAMPTLVESFDTEEIEDPQPELKNFKKFRLIDEAE